MSEAKTTSSTPPPRDVRVHKSSRVLELEWSPEDIGQVPFRIVRLDCRCAFCVDEHTGERLLIPANVPEDISMTNLELVGNYALRIHWTDNHASGLFTWTHLRELSDQARDN